MALSQWTLTQGVFLWFSCALSTVDRMEWDSISSISKQQKCVNVLEIVFLCACAFLSSPEKGTRMWFRSRSHVTKTLVYILYLCISHDDVMIRTHSLYWIFSLRLAELPQHLIGAHSMYFGPDSWKLYHANPCPYLPGIKSFMSCPWKVPMASNRGL